MRWAAILLVLGAACQFDPSGLATDGGATDNVDAADATLGSPDADPFCGWGYDPVHFDPCAQPPAGLQPLSLTISGSMPPYVYNTTNGVLRDPMMTAVDHQNTEFNGYRILWTSDFEIASGAILHAIGTMPLIIASKSDIDIAGDLTVASFFNMEFVSGAGSEPTACPNSEPPYRRGEDCEHGGGGGGGGAFSGNGGNGGLGAPAHTNCNDPDEFVDGNTGATGGLGGVSVSAPMILRGGCEGREGGERNNGSTDFGIGAPGGGAVHLTAAGTLTVTGRINAGGGGGRKSTGSRSGGGGGGSGGMIGLEAIKIDLAAGGVLAANGGGGGGGSGDNGPAFAGDDASPDGAQALGGAGEPTKGSDGGDGSWMSVLNGETALVSPDRGGGGGGGGAGYILYYQDTEPDLSAEITPAAIAAP